MTVDYLVNNPEKVDELLKELDKTVSGYEYGLPLYEPDISRLREIVYRWMSKLRSGSNIPFPWGIAKDMTYLPTERYRQLEEVSRRVIEEERKDPNEGPSWDLAALAKQALTP